MNEERYRNSMSSLINRLLNGFTNTTSTGSSGEKEIKMFKLQTNVPELDRENHNLFRASALLENMGNVPSATLDDWYNQLLTSGLPAEEHESVTLAAISIETMMSLDLSEAGLEEPTIH